MKVGVANKDAVAGFLILAVAGLFALKASELPMGTALRLGPGYFPLVLSGVLALLGLAVLVNGLVARGALPSRAAWRGLAVIIAAVVLFAAAVRPLGFVPTLAATALLSTMASARFRLAPSLLLTAGLVAFSWGLFIWAIGLPLQSLGPWLGGY